MRRSGFVTITAVVTSLTLGVAAWNVHPVSTAVGSTSPQIGFGVPSVADPIHTAGEPSIGIDSNGRVYVSGPTGTGTQRSVWESSVDGGRTYQVITPDLPPMAIQSLQDPPGGGDTDMNFDRNGRTYFIDLYALACNRVAETPNAGATVSQNVFPGGCAGMPGADRPWLAVWDPAKGAKTISAYHGPTPLIYAEYNNLTTGAQWNKSTDGITYTNATNGASSSYGPFGADGYPAIDQYTGKVFQAAGMNGGLYLNIGTPDASGNLTFLDNGGNTSNLIPIARTPQGSPDTLFTVLSMDRARNLFVAWVTSGSRPEDDQTFVSVASASSGWKTWSSPVQVSSPPSMVSVFPWIKAGAAGRADVVWYGSDKSIDPSTNAQQKWNVFMSQVVYPTSASGAIATGAPSVTQVQVTPHPMHYNGICLLGTGCITSQGNRNLADFFSMTVDHSGAAEIVYDDTSNRLIQNGFAPSGNQTVDHAGAPVITVIRQSSGPGLYGSAVTGASNQPRSMLSDPAGDARYPLHNGVNQPALDLQGTRLDLSGQTLRITLSVTNPGDATSALSSIPGAAILQYVTRWQMGDRIYYAGMENTVAGSPTFYAGAAKSVDLCSVSACFPHVVTYPEAKVGGTAERGHMSCPAHPSPSQPCTITILVNTKNVGSPTATSELEEVGTYAMATSHLDGKTTNPQAQADNVPLEIDGACCINYQQP